MTRTANTKHNIGTQVSNKTQKKTQEKSFKTHNHRSRQNLNQDNISDFVFPFLIVSWEDTKCTSAHNRRVVVSVKYFSVGIIVGTF